MSDKDPFVEQTEAVLATIARLFAMEGAAREVAILANSKATTLQTDYDNWNGGTYIYTLYLQLPLMLYSQVEREKEQIQQTIVNKLNSVIVQDDCCYGKVQITLELANDLGWRDKANSWLKDSNISNQGRVRSDNIASRNCDGLLFRSQAEINFYKALKSYGVSFAPLPVFIRGGKTYRRIEPDFFIVKDGIALVVEIDGDTVHQESPAEAHDRTTMLLHEGVHFERILASECETEKLADQSAKRILDIITKIKDTR